ncbi:N-acetylglucosamine-1-phosphodiester alpha-N-acetylglucosaminidase-like [Babylonia areolata]|uniref:N-acetylglucosamine-1-phosphodiester alpha-N-acetylglucosaminidase-like n=1 Tax=Babylonia areolata TaxID=304850 RepID=UPI003FD4F810
MELLKFQIFSLWIFSLNVTVAKSASEAEDDDVQWPFRRRSRDTQPDSQTCQHNYYGNTSYSLYMAHVNHSDFSQVVDIHHKLAEVGDYYYMKRNIVLRFQRVYNPQRTLSVLEPRHHGSCEESPRVRATVQETASKNQCVFAANAGFFDTHSGECLGNIVSDGRLVQDSQGLQNAHFGITKQGQIFTGYLSEIELVTLQFEQLVGGVVWLLRDGEVYVDTSRDMECPDTEETGTLDRFISVVSARTAVGHDAQGRVLMVQVDGKTDKQGVDLYELATILKELGFVNAINLDGGGSATSVVNGTVVNYPSDACVNSTWNCARQVSTILCVHAVQCAPDPACSDHGRCVSGRCLCRPPWKGEACEVLACPRHCSRHGRCLEGGCLCDAGRRGADCSQRCEEGKFGINCSGTCQCRNSATCDPASGVCHCRPGYTGTHCETKCGYGWYGEGCQKRCDCPHECFCHHVSGLCSNTTGNADYLKASQCLLTAAVKKDKLVPDQTHQLLLWKWVAVAAGVVTSISIGINVMLAVALCSKKSKRRRQRRQRQKPYPFKARSTEAVELVPLRAEDDSSFAESSNETDEDVDVFEKKSYNQSKSSGKR